MACARCKLNCSCADAAGAAPDKDGLSRRGRVGVAALGERERKRLLLEKAGGCRGDGEGQHRGGGVGEGVRDLRDDECVQCGVELEAALGGVVGEEGECVAVGAQGKRRSRWGSDQTYPKTRSPFLTCVTPSPTSWTSPATSVPRMLGYF